MKGIKITDESLVDFFGDNEPFSFAENLEGEIYRKYEILILCQKKKLEVVR